MSSHQPNTDWARVAAAGYRFAFIKATEGTTYTNPFFLNDWAMTLSVGLVRGAYHFAQPDENPPEAEADHFFDSVSPGSEDIMVLDLEVGSGDLADWAMRFAARRPGPKMLYSGVPFMQAHGLDRPEVCHAFGDKLWIAAYSSSKPALPAGWPELTFWQRTDAASIPGIAGGCDCSVYLP